MVWKVLNETGRYAPPMVGLKGTVLMEGPNSELYPVKVFIRHRCDPKQQAAWEAHKAAKVAQEAVEAQEAQTRAERAADAREQAAAERAIHASMRDEAYRRAAHVDCPRCPAKEAEECLNLNTLAGRGKGNKHTSWPHPERVLLAEQEGY